jgi:hypothetical protein
MDEWEAEIEYVPTTGGSGCRATNVLVAAVGASTSRSIR